MDEEPAESDRILAAFCHAGTIIGFAVIAPLIIYFLQQKGSAFVRFHALQSIIFQLIAFVLVFVLAFMTCGLGVLLILPWFLFELWMAYRAFQGEWAAYPLMENIGRE
jgi:uncharacterized membrane protein